MFSHLLQNHALVSCSIIQSGRYQMIFEIDAIQLILEILEENKRYFVAKNGKFYW